MNSLLPRDLQLDNSSAYFVAAMPQPALQLWATA
jgi:hypothetical protein